MSNPTVYLAGPIIGCTPSEAKDWRIDFAVALAYSDIWGVSPLRCEPLTGTGYLLKYSDPKFGTARAIAAKNMFDVLHCDMTLAYIPKPRLSTYHSLGTVCELAWARMANKPTILVTDDPFIRKHPVLSSNAGWLLGNLEDALEVIVGILGGYTAQGKHT